MVYGFSFAPLLVVFEVTCVASMSQHSGCDGSEQGTCRSQVVTDLPADHTDELTALQARMEPGQRYRRNQTSTASSYFHELSAHVRDIHAAAHHYHESQDCVPQSMQKHLRKSSTKDVEMRLRERKPVSFIRIGDGDVFCLSGAAGSNLEGISYSDHQGQCKDLATSLQQLGSEDDSNMYVLVGTFFLCQNNVGSDFDSFLQTHEMHHNFKGFITSVFYLDLTGRESPAGSGNYGSPPNPVVPATFPSLLGRKVVVIGPPHLRKLSKTLNTASFLEASNAADHVDDLVRKMKHESSKWPQDNVVFLVSGGFGGRLAILKAFKDLGQKDSFIDTGASLDGFAGEESRSFNHRGRLCKLLPQFMAPGICSCNGNDCSAA